MKTKTIVRAKLKAFSTESAREYEFLVSDNNIQVWDSVAGYFTSRHALSEAAKQRVIKLASNIG